MRYMCRIALGVTVAAALCTPAYSADVNFTGIVVNSCVLSVSTPGVLTPSTDGSVLQSEAGGGAPALLGVVAVGTAPTLNFAAPTVSTPNGFSGTATPAISYQSIGGANQPYTSAAHTTRSGVLLDTFTIHSRVVGAAGFATGTYGVRTVVTCQQ